MCSLNIGAMLLCVFLLCDTLCFFTLCYSVVKNNKEGNHRVARSWAQSFTEGDPYLRYVILFFLYLRLHHGYPYCYHHHYPTRA